MRKVNKTCIACGKDYYFCNSCADNRHDPIWKMTWCSENCKDVFATVSEYKLGNLSAEDALTKLSELDVDVEFKQKLNSEIDEIFAAYNELADDEDAR